MKRINIIGFGNAGVTFYNNLKTKTQIHSVLVKQRRSEDIPFVYHAEALSQQVDFNLVCVNDDAIASIANILPKHVPVVHTSGSAPLSVFSEFDYCGVLYPLQTLSKTRAIDMSEIPFLIEGNDSAFENKLREFCDTHLSKENYRVSSEQRLQVHIAAVICNNFSTYLFGKASEMLTKQGLDDHLLNALINETASKFTTLGYTQSQTGPARRGDETTIQKHLALLEDPEMKKIYELISRAIQKKFTV